jgi:hypothetical protein
MNRFVRALASSRPLRHASAGLAVTLFAVATGAVWAQSPRTRITAPVDDQVRVTLPGSVPALARAEYDLGEAPASTQLASASLVLRRGPEQQAALKRALAEIEDPSSPSYHHWITPEEFGRRFGPADADVAAIVNWLDGEGVSSITVSKGRSIIEFSGSVGLIEQVFRTSFHSFRRGSQEFIANVTEPSIPAALAPVVAGVSEFNTIAAESDLVAGPAGRFDPATHRLVLAPSASQRPEYTGVKNSNPFLFITPGDVATMYNTPNSKLNANFAGGKTYDGTGVTIGIIGESPFSSTTDIPILKNFRGLFLPSTYGLKFTVTNVDDATSSNALDEAFLDMETAGGMAPGAALHFYTAHSIYTAITQALDDNTVDIINVSFGACEKNEGTDNQVVLDDWQRASMQGIAVTVSAGDTGSARCDANGSEEAAGGLAVNFLASTEYDVAVGGTDTWGLVNNFSEYVNPASSDAASDYYRTVTKPILESTWNNSQDSPTQTPGPISTAMLIENTVDAGGGGASSCSIQSASGACISGYAKPSFQTGNGVPHDGVRDLPDVALLSGTGRDNAGWAVCSEDFGDCTVENGGGIAFFAIGGTSAAAPTFAGMLALVEQKTGERLGQSAVSELYSLFNKYGSEVFNDITLGNNAPPCYAPSADLPSPNCAKNTEGFYFESGYNTTPGYDQATGLGSVNVTNLVALWGGSSSLPAKATVTVAPASSTVFRGHPLSVAITVSGSSGTPTGTVKLSGGGFTSAATALASGKATIVIPANALAAGSDTLAAKYSGDAKFGSASGSAKVTVTLLATTVTVKPTSASVSRAKSLEVGVTVDAEKATPEGTVTLSGPGYTSPATALAGGKAHITIPAGKLTAGRDKLTVTYHGAADFKAATGDAVVTVTKAPTAVTVKPAVADMAKTVSLNVTVKVTAAAGTPAGTVTLVSGAYRSVAIRLTRGEAVVIIPAGKLAVGKDTLSASYSGSIEDATATGKATVTVSQ